MTHDLVEQMAGHRTRLVQEEPEQRYQAEDQALTRYLELSQAMDGTAAPLSALLPRGWLLLGLLGVAPAFVIATHEVAALAAGLGGMLLARRALDKLSRSLTDLAGAAIAWHQVAHLYHAAARPVAAGSPGAATVHDTPLLEGQSVTYRYPDQPKPVLQPCHFRLGREARVLLQGPSGGGKSTLVALLAGLRQPAAGSLRLYGLDRQTLGAEVWRQHIAVAPQFNENHVLTGTLAFNLLLGRRWPARPEEVQEVEALCHELGLGSLLATMPAGLLQVVGESGWQLSHGERSRLYLARALLQNAELVILDESFAALDPENLRHALQVARGRAPALLVIAHP
jgi:ATP-binding cassette subfamily B protein